MRRLAYSLLLAAMTVAPAVAHAQSDEPAPPGGGPMSIDPNARPDDAPAAKKGPTPLPSDFGKFQLGARVRGVFVTKAMLSPYLAKNTGTSVSSYAVGLEFIYRKDGGFAKSGYDVVTSIDFSSLNPGDGNYLASGHDPTVDTHYVQFRDLSLLSADVSLIGYYKFLPWLELRYGGGLGIGWVPGTVSLINDNSPGCATHANDPKMCYPLNVGSIDKSNPNLQEHLEATEGKGTDSATNPVFHKSGDKPPVMGVVNLLVGVRFYPLPRLGITYEIGFRDAIFTGLSVHYLF